jgi:hypothetical protein
MTVEQKLIAYNPIFDYIEFLEKETVWDCRIIFADGSEMKCHKLILANSSKFFFNAFTGDMAEQSTGIVQIQFNPENLLQKVIRWMYNGDIKYDDKSLMQLYAVVHFYGIEVLKADVEKKINEVVNDENVLEYANSCYEMDLQESLNALAPIIGKNILNHDVNKLSEILDVRVYSLAIKESGLSDEAKLKNMKEFLGDYELNEDEKQMLRDSLSNPNAPLVKKILPEIYKQ